MRVPDPAEPGPSRPAEAGVQSPITALLQSWSSGDEHALDRLVPLVYDDLRRLARRHLRHERDDHTLQSTGLVHEAFMRLAQRNEFHLASRGQFFGWMSMLMRRILVDHARGRHTAKRGSGISLQSWDALQEVAGEAATLGEDEAAILGILELDEALHKLAELDDRQGRVVELRFFGGLSVDETAEAIGVSAATVKREWSTARAWLLRELGRPKAARP